MYLKALTINGFKSFAKKGELEFSAPITAIVGPNGSGKSNVAESFRFVLGEQSVKSMRGKRGEDLIWGGSESVARGNRASVEVVLDNAKRQFPLDFDEIQIERIVHRDGQNEYLLNGSQVRLKDIQELLAVANIGPTGHHIISQGEADRILSASARERREMIEDALGLKVYQLKKQEAERKLKKTEENIREVEALRREAAPHLKYLEKQVQKIQKSLELQARLKEVYVEYLKREDTYIAHHADRLQAARREPAEQLDSIKAQLEEAKRILRATEQQDGKRGDVVAAEERWRAATKQRQSLLVELGKIEGQLSYIVRRIEEQARKAQSPRATTIPRGELERVIGDIEQQVAKVMARDDVSLIKRALTDVVHRLRTLLERATDTTGVDEVKVLEHEQHDLQKAQQKLAKDIQDAEAAEAAAREAYEAVRATLEAEAQGAREAERDVFRLVGEQRSVETTIERIDRELEILDRDRQEFKRELQEAVTLIGRDVARYYEAEVMVEGVALTTEAIVVEDRATQRTRRHELEKLKIRLEELGLGATDDVMKEYQNAKERDEFLEREIADLTESVGKLRALIVDLTAQLHEQFFAGIDKISVEFNNFFTLMFGGGEASLERVEVKTRARGEVEVEEGEVPTEDEETETEVGIELAVKLPNKRVKGLEMLSGGERALTSIALIFAMSQVNPPPFVILDETDAALDEANSRRYGDLIEALAQKSQLILITHNRETMSRASILYGITMGSDGVSKLLSVRLEDALAVAK